VRSFRAGRAHRWAWPTVVVLGVSLLAGGCTSSGDDEDSATDLERAQADVAAKEKDLAEAQDTAQGAIDAFCSGSIDYVKALDRYGDVITAEAPTVGDVVTGGSDLREPRDEALEAGQSAQQAQQDVAEAQNALAEAKATLATLEASASGEPVEPSEEPTAEATPLAPADAVNRVKQADADFTSTQQGISDETPLDQASQQFNAAVVALEMAWMQLVVQAGCLDDEQRVAAQDAARAYTLALQQGLADAGYYTLAVDGIYGPGTVQAVQDLQSTHGLPVTGTVDKATDAALQADLAAKGAAQTEATMTSTAALQQTLKLAGYWDGPVDGQWTDELTAALVQFQTDLGVAPTGAVDAATVGAFEAAIAALKEPAPAPTETSGDDEAADS
jgi:peptidoglycan hydrolase-like protein with peptidoglycan-binding domain